MRHQPENVCRGSANFKVLSKRPDTFPRSSKECKVIRRRTCRLFILYHPVFFTILWELWRTEIPKGPTNTPATRNRLWESPGRLNLCLKGTEAAPKCSQPCNCLSSVRFYGLENVFPPSLPIKLHLKCSVGPNK